jgi:predicted ATPase
MIKKLFFENFRGLIKNEIELGKITVLTGPNNSGKSSIIYGLLALKNLVSSPNQSMDSFLNLGFVSLGGFSQTVYLKDDNLNILLGIIVSRNALDSQYSALLGKKKSELRFKALEPLKISLDLEVTFPYPANRTTGCTIEREFGPLRITWNGLNPTVTFDDSGGATPTVNAEGRDLLVKRENMVKDILNSFGAPIEELGGVDFIPIRRGFVKPVYSSVPMQKQLLILTDDELATLLASDRDLEGRVAFYLEKIVDRVFSVRPIVATANFNLQSRDRSTGLVCDLVNEGFGTNQLITILTKSLRREMHTICIEESEIHLHPELMDNLVDVFTQIVKDEDKNFIISTHSEHIVLALLNKVAQKKISPNDVRVYYLSKDGLKTRIERQEVNEKGQIKGGLRAFYETELREVKEFFSVPEEK